MGAMRLSSFVWKVNPTLHCLTLWLPKSDITDNLELESICSSLIATERTRLMNKEIYSNHILPKLMEAVGISELQHTEMEKFISSTQTRKWLALI
jgi:hypothetical protein